jgi:hypothetical protein
MWLTVACPELGYCDGCTMSCVRANTIVAATGSGAIGTAGIMQPFSIVRIIVA